MGIPVASATVRVGWVRSWRPHAAGVRRALVSTRGALGTVLVALVASITAPQRGVAQDTIPQPATFTLTGQIVDAVNESPVISAVIKVPSLRRYVFSDTSGRFRFPDFPEGTWEIVVEMLGYHTLDGSVTVAEGNGLILRLEPDPIALEGLRVRSRAERLLSQRRLTIPYRVTTISTETFARSISPDPTAIFRRNARSQIIPCPETEADAEEQMTPGCFRRRGRSQEINVYLDEGRMESGMVELALFPKEDIHSMDWIPEMGELRIYTRHFIERLDSTNLSLSPLVYP